MMNLLKMNSNGQVTIPNKLRKKLKCKAGDYFEITADKDGIKLKPAKVIDPDQAWFWTEEWQKGEREADNDIKNGNYTTFKNMEELKKHFRKTSK
jgi:antitoxin MazE